MVRNERSNSLDERNSLQEKADSLRAINMGSVDRDLNELAGAGAKGEEGEAIEEEDYQAISEAIAEVEKEIDTGSSGDMVSVVIFLISAAVAYWKIPMFTQIVDDVLRNIHKFYGQPNGI